MADTPMQRFVTALDGTGYLFAHYGWSKAPDGDYGVYAENGAEDFIANDVHLESALTGSLDYFTRDASGTPKTVIENAINSLGIAWHLNTVQFEDDTGYIHYEWIWGIYGQA